MHVSSRLDSRCQFTLEMSLPSHQTSLSLSVSDSRIVGREHGHFGAQPQMLSLCTKMAVAKLLLCCDIIIMQTLSEGG